MTDDKIPRCEELQEHKEGNPDAPGYTVEMEPFEDFGQSLIVKRGGEVILREHDRGEPEDAYFYRDWEWVPEALRKAYAFGLEDGSRTAKVTSATGEEAWAAFVVAHDIDQRSHDGVKLRCGFVAGYEAREPCVDYVTSTLQDELRCALEDWRGEVHANETGTASNEPFSRGVTAGLKQAIGDIEKILRGGYCSNATKDK